MKLQSLIAPFAVYLVADVMAATVPGAPTNVAAAPWPYTEIISFTPPADNGGAPITSYTVTAVGRAWYVGTGPTSPVMVQGGPLQWNGDTNSFTVTATNSVGTGPASAPSPKFGPPYGGKSANVYMGGIFYWQGDFNYGGGGCSYADTSGHPVNSPYDVMLYGGCAWQPYSPGSDYDLTGDTFMVFDLKPTIAGDSWVVYYEKVGDLSVNAQAVAPSDANGTYGPTPVVGKWATYKVPLENMNVGPGTDNVHIYKFCIKSQTNSSANTWYVNNVHYITAASNAGTPVVAAPVDRMMNVAVNNRTVSFSTKHAGTIRLYDLVGNKLAAWYTEVGGHSWTAKSAGAYIVRFEGTGTAGTIETKRILVK